MRHTLLTVSITFLLVTVAGCGEKSARYASRSVEVAPPSDGPAATDLANVIAKPAAGEGQPAAAVPANLGRKIAYTVQMRMTVESLGEAEQKLLASVQTLGGYVAKGEMRGSQGRQRSGLWTVKVPSEKLDSFIDEVERLGELEQKSTDSKDVTDEYFDVDARVKGKKIEEQRLLEIIEEKTGDLADVLAVERELSRVRGEIEQLQGRLNLLSHLSTMATVTIELSEPREFTPVTAAPFPTTIVRTFQNSSDALLELLRGIVLVCVAIVPWLVIILPTAFILWRLRRRELRRASAAAPQA